MIIRYLLIVDSTEKKSFDMKLGNWFDIDSPEALNDYLDWYISYLLGEGQEFLDYYSYLPNILKKNG